MKLTLSLVMGFALSSQALASSCPLLLSSLTAREGDPFVALNSKKARLLDLQWYSLDALRNDASLPQYLRDIASKKIAFFKEPPKSDWSALWSAAPHEMRTQRAAEFALQSFGDPNLDGEFRGELFRYLANSANSDASTVERLMPIARGVRYAANSDLQSANETIRQIVGRIGSYPKRFSTSPARTDVTDILLHEPVESVKNLGGGINETLVVTFQNGKKAVFKPRSGEAAYASGDPNFVDFTRETTASPLIEKFLGNASSRAHGQSPLLISKSAAVALSFNGKSYGLGSIQAFAEGYTDIEKIATDPRYANFWKTLYESPQWRQVDNRIRTLDFIMGNYDRLPLYLNGRIHPKNFMIRIPGLNLADPSQLDQQLAKLDLSKVEAVLIDNGLGRNSIGGTSTGSFDINGMGNFPLRADIPADLKAAITSFDEAGFRARMSTELPEWGINDVINRVRAAQHRIQAGP